MSDPNLKFVGLPTGTESSNVVGTKSEEPLMELPTGKVNISFSELRTWKECSFRHKLQHVNKIDLSKPGTALDFGTSCHAAHEAFIKTRTMDVSIATKMLTELWNKHNHDAALLAQATKEATACLTDVPNFYDTTFPGWKSIDAEHYLYERIPGQPHVFKGYIDAIIEAPGPRSKPLVWILDVKTTSWGWTADKKSDDMVRAQLVLYKNFWSAKTGTNPKDVRCGFILLKRAAKPGSHCELVTTSVGDVTIGRSLKIISNMLSSVKKGIALKNRASCTFCDYRGTVHCT